MDDLVAVDLEGLRVEHPAASGRVGDREGLLPLCPVRREGDAWVLVGHAEVASAASDPSTFSSAVTARRAIPNSLDGAEHAAFRAVVDRYLTPQRVAVLEPRCREVAREVVDALPREVIVEAVAEIGVPLAVRAQSAWLGWPQDLEGEVVEWMRENRAATRSGDRGRTAAVAEWFDRIIRGLLEVRREAPIDDVTGELMRDSVDGRALTDEEIVSILRNWTAGDLGTVAASVGVVVHMLAARPAVQRQLRALAVEAAAPVMEAAVEELLRMDDPFISSRRVVTREVHVGGVRIPAGGRVLLNWTAANRDPGVFGDPDHFSPGANASANLVFGAGPHVCPGRGLTLMELRVLTEELLARTTWIGPAPEQVAVRGTPPVGGWACVPVVLR